MTQGIKKEQSLAAVFLLYKPSFADWLSYFVRKAFFMKRSSEEWNNTAAFYPPVRFNEQRKADQRKERLYAERKKPDLSYRLYGRAARRPVLPCGQDYCQTGSVRSQLFREDFGHLVF